MLHATRVRRGDMPLFDPGARRAVRHTAPVLVPGVRGGGLFRRRLECRTHLLATPSRSLREHALMPVSHCAAARPNCPGTMTGPEGRCAFLATLLEWNVACAGNRSMRHPSCSPFFVLLLLSPLLALGCGGRANQDATVDSVTGSLDSGADSGSSSGATGTGDASSCQPTFVEPGPGTAGGAEIPIYHRAEPACCPTERGPSPSGQPYGTGQAAGCTSDSQCTSGVDGRCFPFEGLVGPGGCSYDQCLTDSDCPSGASCLCRSSASDSSPNICVAGGNCVLDSDCGEGGYCSPSNGCEGPAAYYCHTAADTCINDSDCAPGDAGGAACASAPSCVYDSEAQHWGCTQMICCPP